MNFKSAKCPSCCGELQITDEMNSVKCLYCGNEIIVKEETLIKANAITGNLENILKLADAALDLLNYDEAYHYYNRALELDSVNYKAWYGKALSDTGRKTDISQIDIHNVKKLVKISITNTPTAKRGEILNTAMIELSSIIFSKYCYILNSFLNNITLDSYNLFVDKSNLAINLLSEVAKYILNKEKTLDNILQIYENYTCQYHSTSSPNMPIVLRYDLKNKALEELKKIRIVLEGITVGADKTIIGPRQTVKCKCGYVGYPKILSDSKLICRKCKTSLANIYISKFLTIHDK